MSNLKVPLLYCPLHEVNAVNEKTPNMTTKIGTKYLLDKCSELSRYTSLLSTEDSLP
jgi:hypothetical protein